MSDMDIVSQGEDDSEFNQTHQTNPNNQGFTTKQEARNARVPDNLGPKRMVDITRDKPIKVTIRVVVPVRDHPKFNFVGKLLGPKGNSLKRLQEDTMTKMAILGRGSMKDRHKEEELRGSGDPKFSHLLEELHVEVTAFAPPAEAHARIAYALAEVRRFLVPDYNDEIRQEQMWEMAALNSKGNGTGANAGGGGGGGGGGGSTGGSGDELSLAEGSASEDSAPAGSPQRTLLPIPNNPGVGLVHCNNARKRPMVANPRLAMSPTKRTVLSILARARAAQAAENNPYGRSLVGITGIGDENLMAGNILIN